MKHLSEGVITFCKKNLDIFIIFISFILAAYLNWSLVGILIFCYIIFFIISARSSVFYIKMTMIFAGLYSILSVLKKDLAEELAILAFCSLIFMTIKLFVEYNNLDLKNKDD